MVAATVSPAMMRQSEAIHWLYSCVNIVCPLLTIHVVIRECLNVVACRFMCVVLISHTRIAHEKPVPVRAFLFIDSE